MGEARDPAIDAVLHEARVAFAQGLVARATDFEAMVAREAWADARRAAHRLRGSAGIYGFAALGAIAAALDELLHADHAPDSSARARIHENLRELRAEAERASREAR
jgi:HPt (histidine-containing phosphotransfer) domain-containing protein